MLSGKVGGGGEGGRGKGFSSSLWREIVWIGEQADMLLQIEDRT